MKLLISACAADAGRSGIGQYIQEIIRRVDSADASSITVYTEADNKALGELSRDGVQVKFLSPLWSRSLPNLVWHLLVLPILLLAGGYDRVLFLAANRRLAWTPGVSSVGVVHDLSQLHIANKYDRFRTFYVLKLLPCLMRRLDQVVCVSQATAKDVIGHARVAAERVGVIYNGADTRRFAVSAADNGALEVLGIDVPYILYTARLEHPGKNHVGLLRAFAILRKNCNLPHKLVFAGSRWPGSEAIDAEIARLGLQDQVILTGFVPNEVLPTLVKHASVFAMPSLYEGFGIPLVEAMAAGTPVCGSRVSSIPEVIGPAGLLFSPTDPQEMAQVLHKLLTEPALADYFVARGRLQAARFCWDNALQQLLARLNEPLATRANALGGSRA